MSNSIAPAVKLAVKKAVKPAMGIVDYGPAAQAIFAAMTTQPSAARKSLINTTIVNLQNAGLWTILPTLQVYAAHDSQAATVDWKAPSRLAVPVNSPAFTVDRGFKGDGATSYVNTKWDSTESWTNDISFGGVRLNADFNIENTSMVMGHERFWIRPQYIGGAARFLNSSGANDVASQSATARWIALNRPDGTQFMKYSLMPGGVVDMTVTARSSSGMVNREVYVGAHNNAGTAANFSAEQISCFYAGAQMTLSQFQQFGNIMDAYMTGVGNTA